MATDCFALANFAPLLSTTSSSAAFRVGQMAGAVLAGLAMFGLLIFAIIAVVKAFTKRTTGWIVAGSVAGLFVLGFGTLVTVGFLMGLAQGIKNGRARHDSAASTSAVEQLKGTKIPFTLEKPPGWQRMPKQEPYEAGITQGNDYIGVIMEEADLESLDAAVGFARARIKSLGSDVTFTDDEPVTIDGRTFNAFHVKAKIQNLPFAYQFYIYTGKEGTVQLIGWTFQNLWNRDSGKIRAAMCGFHFPPSDAPAAESQAAPAE